MSTNYSPIISRHRLHRLAPYKRLEPEPGVAIVLFRNGEPRRTLWPGDRLSAEDLLRRSYSEAYRIDISEQLLLFNERLPSKGDLFSFDAQISLLWSVQDPVEVVKRNIVDADAALKSLIIPALRTVSRRYDPSDAAIAEADMEDAVRPLGSDIGLRFERIAVHLGSDENAARSLQYERLEQAISQDRNERELVLERDRHRRELELERTRHELDLTRMRTEFYREIIGRGQWAMFALHLAHHPEEIDRLVDTLNQQKETDRRLQLQFLRELLETGVVSELQLDTRVLLERLIEQLSLGAGESNDLQKSIEATTKPPGPGTSSDDDPRKDATSSENES